LNDNWGWHAGDRNWKDGGAIVRALVTAAGRGGNLLLNIGPRGDGSVPEQSVAALRQAGAWLERNRAFLADSGRSPFGWNNSALVTVRGSSVWLHLFCDPGSTFCWPELANRVLGVHLLTDGSPLAWEQDADGRLIIHGLRCSDPIATVLRIDVDGEPRPRTRQGTFWIPA
jgi:alpha-L-fucosidase